MTDCEGCLNPDGGLYMAGCRQCSIRRLARGPEFYASVAAQRIVPAYLETLRALFGDDWKAGHEEVKAEAKRYRTGARG